MVRYRWGRFRICGDGSGLVMMAWDIWGWFGIDGDGRSGIGGDGGKGRRWGKGGNTPHWTKNTIFIVFFSNL